MFESFRGWLAHWIGIFLKTYNLGEVRPRPPQRKNEDWDQPKFIDRFAERNSDPDFLEVDQKIRDAVAQAKWDL